MISFHKLVRFAPLRRALVAFSVLSAIAGASAAEGNLDPHLVNAADVSAAKNLMLQNPKEAVGALRDLKDRLVRYGLADDSTTVQNVYWLYAQAAADVDCVAAYKAIYQSAALGFVAQAPRRAEIYQKRESKLLQCLPEGTRERVEQDAWREVRTSPLRDMVSLDNVKDAHSASQNAAQLVTQAFAEAQAQANVITNPSERPAQSASPTMEGVVDNIKSAFSALFSVVMALVTMSILLSIYSAAGGKPSKSSQAAEHAAPQPSTAAKTGTHRAKSGRSATSAAQRPAGATKRRRAGLVRVRPWD